MLQRLNANFVLVLCAVEGLGMNTEVGGTEGTAVCLSEGSIASNGSASPQKIQKIKVLLVAIQDLLS